MVHPDSALVGVGEGVGLDEWSARFDSAWGKVLTTVASRWRTQTATGPAKGCDCF